jgi:beta-lactamase class A
MNCSSIKFLLLLTTKIFLLVLVSGIANAQQIQPISIQEKLIELETSSGGRLGISAINTANNHRIQYRAEERFPMGCTSKVIGVSAVLKKSMADNSFLEQRVTYTKQDLINWTPITEKHLIDGMTISELSAAAISYSDNTAMNLLVKKIGGLQEINAFARSIKDNFFRQDNGWPREAMSGGLGNLQDSSTPAAMEKSLQRLVFGDVLALPQRELLLAWLKNSTTGNARIRAGVPRNWLVGDKTGTGIYYGTTNDIGIIWPPKCDPIIVAVYYTHNKKEAIKREDIIASVTHMLINEFAHTDQCIKSNLITH